MTEKIFKEWAKEKKQMPFDMAKNSTYSMKDMINFCKYTQKKQSIIHSVASGEIRANKELIELIKMVKGVEKENIGKCVDMTIRDVVRIPIDRLKRRFNKESI